MHMCAGERRNQSPVKLSRDFAFRRGGSRNEEMELAVFDSCFGFQL